MIRTSLISLPIIIILSILTACALLKSRGIDIWIWSYVAALFGKEKPDASRPVHIYFAVADHFEPFHNKASKAEASRKVRQWCSSYPRIADKFKDADGNHPRHTIFYPEEVYDFEIMTMLAQVCKTGYFDVEVHLHHDNDTSEQLREKLIKFKETLYSKHGLLRKDFSTDQVIYGFIHGNWALDNSRADGRMCGVNNELIILKDTGCYADFTLPSSPSTTQTRKINSIYYAVDDPDKPKSHDSGIDVAVNGGPHGDLLIIQGPLTLNWRNRKFGLLPRVENGDICYGTEVTAERVRLWIEHAPVIKGEPNARFIKVYTHGCQGRNTEYLLEEGLEHLYAILCGRYNDGKKYVLHFVSAYEMSMEIKKRAVSRPQ